MEWKKGERDEQAGSRSPASFLPHSRNSLEWPHGSDRRGSGSMLLRAATLSGHEGSGQILSPGNQNDELEQGVVLYLVLLFF